MLHGVERLVNEALKAADLITMFNDQIRCISHYDADGISSASIMAAALSRAGKSFHLSMVKQLNGDVIREVAQENPNFLIFTDLGSGQLSNIQKYLCSHDATIIILDHHQVQGEISSENAGRMNHINSTVLGIDENISGAGVTYLVARAMSHENTDLSELAIVGAIGDSQTGSIGDNWGLSGLNREILKDAQNTNKIEVTKGLRLWGMYTRPVHKALEYSVDPYIPGVSGSESGSIQFLQELGINPKGNDKWRPLADLSREEQQNLASGIIRERIRGNQEDPQRIFGDVYRLLSKPKEFSNANEFATLLNACGKLKKAHLGVCLCLGDKEAYQEARQVLEGYRKEIGRSISWIYSNKSAIKETDNAIYILAGDSISEHMISNVASIISKSGPFQNKPLFALADAEDGKVKVSARAGMDSADMKYILSEAARQVGGEGGGHVGSAGAVIPKGAEETFINIIEGIVKKGPISAEGSHD